MRILVRTAAIAMLGLGLSTSAMAAGGHAEPAAHGEEAAHADAEHGGDHGGHHYYTEDHDHDGTPNWLDADCAADGDPACAGTYMVMPLFWHFFNFVLLFGLLYKFAGPGISTALQTRAAAMREEISEAAKVREDALAREKEMLARLEGLESELADVAAKAKAQAEADRVRIEKEANERAARILESAERKVQERVMRAKDELRKETVNLAVELAEGILRGSVEKDDQQRLASEFLSAVNGETRV